MNKVKKQSKPLKQIAKDLLAKMHEYIWAVMLIFFIIVYAFVLLKINNFVNQKPSQAQVSTYIKSTVQPAINQNVVNQLEQLQNNSVSVQALFNQARQNPFQ